ncbi:dTDP-4-dehydrorhamnose 3,5-epimerase [Shewanella sp. Choline-02u-19]|uniref:dTDP-4-dehydrorhamnose 3,5-epimerase n=1 Tax=unclassified Shewanella TaxID=196818 RepID=UPI000C34744C|nr:MULTISPECIES: dTDP-4-dehydrorhamnose 3,5-epimerase [unclassified Shewanella]PKH60641.1 dTDP-4-dehydrorhamnose 3,5-epimerase [Shewanella sp. Bg11-22]PKI26930.1 dTDP-4-dehydrorhamnose 3,5-epimerase [Shewanella sp. Choline-02u-19]
MKLISTAIADVLLFESQRFGDERGFFMETFRQSQFDKLFEGLGLTAPTFVQENMSRSAKDVLRGLHFQKNHPQGKLIRVVAGEVFDVAVDIRAGSATFGQWVGQILSAENRLQLYIPAGFAHGFLTLSEHADIIYKCTDYYVPGDEGIIAWNDADIAIKWPLETGVVPILSDKDRKQRR